MFQPKAVFGRPRAEIGWLSKLPVRVNERIARALSDVVIGPARAYRGLPEPATRNLNELPPVVNNLLPYWIQHGRIDVAPAIARFEGRRVHFADGTSREFDTILWATGFKVTLPFLDMGLVRVRDGVPLRTAGLTLPVGAENLYLIGMAAPRGPQLPVYSEQTELVARMLRLHPDRRSALAARFAEIDVPDARIDIVRAIWQRQMRDAHRTRRRARALRAAGAGGPMSRLAGRVALITGGARGQGASHAERLAREGAIVVTGDVLDEAGEETAARLRADGLDVPYRHLDVTDPGDWAAAVVGLRAARRPRQQRGHHPRHAAAGGVARGVERPAGRQRDGHPARACRPRSRRMRAAGGGSIINVASIFGVTGSEGYIAYTASKAAIIAMTKTAALEHAADRIRVNAICPGGVSTPMNESEPEGGVVPLTPLGRRAHVSEISGAIAYLASDDASFVTGTELVIDGGYLAR